MSPERILDWKNVVTSPSGRRVLAQLLKELGDVTDVFSPGSPDRTAYQAGRASASTTIKMHLGEVSPTVFYEILLEKAKEDDLTRKSRPIER